MPNAVSPAVFRALTIPENKKLLAAHMCENELTKVREISMKFRNFFEKMFLHIRVDLIEFVSQMPFVAKNFIDIAENGPPKVGKFTTFRKFVPHFFLDFSTHFSFSPC